MVKNTGVVAFAICCFLITGCFISDNVVEEFRKINASVEKSGQVIRSRNAEAMYTVLQRCDKSAYLRADTLSKLNIDACNYIDSLKKIMLRYDPKGDNINIPADLLVNTRQGLKLQQKLANVYRYAHSILPDTVKRVTKDMLVFELRSTVTDTAWARKIFRSVPTMSAVTTLSSIELNCLELEEKALAHFITIPRIK